LGEEGCVKEGEIGAKRRELPSERRKPPTIAARWKIPSSSFKKINADKRGKKERWKKKRLKSTPKKSTFRHRPEVIEKDVPGSREKIKQKQKREKSCKKGKGELPTPRRGGGDQHPFKRLERNRDEKKEPQKLGGEPMGSRRKGGSQTWISWGSFLLALFL